MTAYLQLLDLGYGSGLVRQITQADARQDEDDMNVVLSTFVVVYGAIGIVSLAAMAILALIVIPRFPNLSAVDVRTAQWVDAIIGFRIALAFPLSVFGAVTTARQRFALTGSHRHRPDAAPGGRQRISCCVPGTGLYRWSRRQPQSALAGLCGVCGGRPRDVPGDAAQRPQVQSADRCGRSRIQLLSVPDQHRRLRRDQRGQSDHRRLPRDQRDRASTPLR